MLVPDLNTIADQPSDNDNYDPDPYNNINSNN